MRERTSQIICLGAQRDGMRRKRKRDSMRLRGNYLRAGGLNVFLNVDWMEVQR